MYLSADVRVDAGLTQSTVEVDDVVWANFESDIRARLGERGYDAEVRPEVFPHEIERRCTSLGAVYAWIDTLNPDED